MENFIICDGKKFIIENDTIYKVLNNKKRKASKNELIKVKYVIENIDKDIFSSAKLNEIAKNNKVLYRIDILPDILRRMEKFIGEELTETFYKNLETVRFEFDDPMECGEFIPNHENGYHDSLNNTIHINAETFECLRIFAKENELDFNLVWKISLAHELFHMASCKNLLYETGHIYQGLNVISYTKKYNKTVTDDINYGKSNSFNEGLTQFLACAIYCNELGDKNFHDFNNSYLVQARVIGQISNIIGGRTLKRAYFKNLGMSTIHASLLQINNLELTYNQLLTNMGRLGSPKTKTITKNTSIVKIQALLLLYETPYFYSLDKENQERLIDRIDYYFVGLWKTMDNKNFSDETKALIQENLNTLNHLREKQKTYKK